MCCLNLDNVLNIQLKILHKSCKENGTVPNKYMFIVYVATMPLHVGESVHR